MGFCFHTLSPLLALLSEAFASITLLINITAIKRIIVIKNFFIVYSPPFKRASKCQRVKVFTYTLMR